MTGRSVISTPRMKGICWGGGMPPQGVSIWRGEGPRGVARGHENVMVAGRLKVMFHEDGDMMEHEDHCCIVLPKPTDQIFPNMFMLFNERQVIASLSQWWVGAMKRRARVQGLSPPLPCRRVSAIRWSIGIHCFMHMDETSCARMKSHLYFPAAWIYRAS